MTTAHLCSTVNNFMHEQSQNDTDIYIYNSLYCVKLKGTNKKDEYVGKIRMAQK